MALAYANADLAAARSAAEDANAAAMSATFAANALEATVNELLAKVDGAARVRKQAFQRIRDLHNQLDFARAETGLARERAEEAEAEAESMRRKARERGQLLMESRGSEAAARAEACALSAEVADSNARAGMLREYLNESIGKARDELSPALSPSINHRSPNLCVAMHFK